MLKRIRELFGRASRTPRDDPASPPPVATAPAEPARRAERPPAVHRGPEVVHRPIPAGDLDADAVKIIHRLTRFDHVAYLVGGCVRDLLLDRRPKDFDVATSATPRQVKRLFSNCRIIGRRFRLAHVYFQSGKIIEVATFRARDEGWGDSFPEEGEDLLIRDDNVFGTPEEDALRRDFTVNALFYDVNTGNVLDHAGGLGDLRRKLVRTIGDPEIRFREDPIRILRAIRFAARLGFDIEVRTLDALMAARLEIPKAAPPRILEEINRLCRAGAARRSFELLFETGTFQVVFPEFGDPLAPGSGSTALLFALLDGIDRRQGSGRDVSTGEILAAVVVAVLAQRLGWREDGTATHARGLNAREATDALVRPFALRLRMSRRDQERCRQIVQTLSRMVPARDLRRSLRQAILRRPAFPDALWFLEAIAGSRGGDFGEALAYWRRGTTGEGTPSSREPERDSGTASGGAERTERGPERGRRRRSRRRRRKEPSEAPGAAAPREDRQRGAPGPLPPPWDDDYFFAALPTAPPLEDEDRAGDRYGAGDLRPEPGPALRPRPQAAADGGREADAPASRKRRRRRPRRGKRPPTGQTVAATEPQEPPGED